MISRNTDPKSVPARFINENMVDPADSWDLGVGAAPGLGKQTPPHIFTVIGRYGSQGRAYSFSDEALRDSRANAERMRTDCGIMECIEARQRATALLNWHIEPEREDSLEQQQLAEEMTAILNRIPRFVEMRRSLMDGIWYGRSAVANVFKADEVNGKWRRAVLCKWEPRHGDKLVFRYDQGDNEYDEDQIGLRVGAGYDLDRRQWKDYLGNEVRKVQATQFGLAYWLDANERKRITVHKHMVEDGPFEDPLAAGSIHGVGIRSRIYWTWYAMIETLGNLLEYLERSALGVEIWRYPANNPVAEAKTLDAAQKKLGGGRSIVLVPVPQGEDAAMYGVEHIEPGMAGADTLRDIIETYFGHKIKRYILGQTLTSEAEATGLGSGVADAHMATFSDIVRYDAINLGESITTDLVRPIQLFNFPKSRGIRLKFVIDTAQDEVEEKLNAFRQFWDMGGKLATKDILEVIGASVPEEGEDFLQNPMMGQDPSMMGGPGGPGPLAGQGDIMGGGDGGQADAEGAPEDFRAGAQAALNDGAALGIVGPQRYSKPIRIPSSAVETNPSEAKREAGNYKKAKLQVHGLNVSIENPAGSRRRPEWPKLKWHYGYIRGTRGADGDQVDAFIGPDPDSEIVFVVDQCDQAGEFDEHKAMIGWSNASAAKKAYLANYSKGWTCGPITAMTIAQFKAWLEHGDKNNGVAYQVSQYRAGHANGAVVERYAKKSSPGQRSLMGEGGTGERSSKQQGKFKWITIGGGEDGSGAKHAGGTPVQVDGQGNIAKGPDALEGKNLDELDDNVAGTEKDKRKQAEADPGPSEYNVEVDGEKLKHGDWLEFKDGTPFRVAHANHDPARNVTTITPSYETFGDHGRVPNEIAPWETKRIEDPATATREQATEEVDGGPDDEYHEKVMGPSRKHLERQPWQTSMDLSGRRGWVRQKRTELMSSLSDHLARDVEEGNLQKAWDKDGNVYYAPTDAEIPSRLTTNPDEIPEVDEKAAELEERIERIQAAVDDMRARGATRGSILEREESRLEKLKGELDAHQGKTKPGWQPVEDNREKLKAQVKEALQNPSDEYVDVAEWKKGDQSIRIHVHNGAYGFQAMEEGVDDAQGLDGYGTYGEAKQAAQRFAREGGGQAVQEAEEAITSLDESVDDLETAADNTIRPGMFDDDSKSTNDKLREAGYTTRKADGPAGETGKRDILDADGQVVFSGRAREVDEWLAKQPAKTQEDEPKRKRQREYSDQEKAYRSADRNFDRVMGNPDEASDQDINRAEGWIEGKKRSLIRQVERGDITDQQAKDQIDGLDSEKDNLRRIRMGREDGSLRPGPETMTEAQLIAQEAIRSQTSIWTVGGNMGLTRGEIKDEMNDIQTALDEERELEAMAKDLDSEPSEGRQRAQQKQQEREAPGGDKLPEDAGDGRTAPHDLEADEYKRRLLEKYPDGKLPDGREITDQVVDDLKAASQIGKDRTDASKAWQAKQDINAEDDPRKLLDMMQDAIDAGDADQAKAVNARLDEIKTAKMQEVAELQKKRKADLEEENAGLEKQLKDLEEPQGETQRSILGEEFDEKRTKKPKGPEFESNDGQQSQLWTGLDQAPGQTDFLEEGLAGTTDTRDPKQTDDFDERAKSSHFNENALRQLKAKIEENEAAGWAESDDWKADKLKEQKAQLERMLDTTASQVEDDARKQDGVPASEDGDEFLARQAAAPEDPETAKNQVDPELAKGIHGYKLGEDVQRTRGDQTPMKVIGQHPDQGVMVEDEDGNRLWLNPDKIQAVGGGSVSDPGTPPQTRQPEEAPTGSGQAASEEPPKPRSRKQRPTPGSPRQTSILENESQRTPSGDPREEAATSRQALDADYDYARASAIPNAGEDLKGSARHQRNAWREGLSAEDAESAGLQKLITRAQLMKNEPHTLLEELDEHGNTLTALAMHYSIASLPVKPGHGKRYDPNGETAQKDRQQYLEAYRSIKDKASYLAAKHSNPKDAIREMRQHIGELVRELRQQKGDSYMDRVTAADRDNKTAAALAGFHDRTLKQGYRASRMKTTVEGKMEIWSKALAQKYNEGKPNLSEAADPQAIAEAMTAHAQDIMEGQSLSKSFGHDPNARKTYAFKPADLYVKHAQREGGRDLNAETANANKAVDYMLDKQGMRGVQWGNSVTDDERAHHGKMSAEAFADLADVCGLDDADISLGGQLGLAIGARGRSGASAHYEPNEKVINLTRNSGVGSLAHEWGHFFDHHVGGGGHEQFLSSTSDSERESSNANPEVKAAMRGLTKSFRESGYQARLRQNLQKMVNDGLMSERMGNYYLKRIEIFARTFERFTQNELHSQGRENSYLVGLRKEGETSIYPTKDEVEKMAPHFRAVFDAFKRSKAAK